MTTMPATATSVQPSCPPTSLAGQTCDELLHEDYSYGCDVLENLFTLDCTGCTCTRDTTTTTTTTTTTPTPSTTSFLRSSTSAGSYVTATTTAVPTNLTSLWALVACAVVVIAILIAVFVHKATAKNVVLPEDVKRKQAGGKRRGIKKKISRNTLLAVRTSAMQQCLPLFGLRINVVEIVVLFHNNGDLYIYFKSTPTTAFYTWHSMSNIACCHHFILVFSRPRHSHLTLTLTLNPTRPPTRS